MGLIKEAAHGEESVIAKGSSCLKEKLPQLPLSRYSSPPTATMGKDV